jgi:tRNA G18 (ribose-2'-O)-methylase SpoU
MGAIFAVPYARCPTWPGGLLRLRELGFRVLALTPQDASSDIADLVVGAEDRIALLLGTEGQGLSRGATDLADATVSIGMSNGVDSLNVAASAALAFWAVARARERP